VSSFASLTEGEESRAFRFARDGQDFVLRINRGWNGFAKDDLAARLFGSVVLPIPEVLLIEALGDGSALCISSLAPGQTLQAMDKVTLTGTLGAVGDVLDAMASADTSSISGYGRFDEHGIGKAAQWRDFIASVADPKTYDWHALGLEGIAGWIDQIIGMAGRLPEHRQLVHGDFGSNNVLADGGKITGVIDWSEAMVGDGLYDVANILFWRPWLDCMEQQARYFETEQPERLADGERMRCYQLRIGLDLIYQSAVEGDADMVEWAKRRCGEIAGG
jgi:hygromycin-B 4-O-kinase